MLARTPREALGKTYAPLGFATRKDTSMTTYNRNNKKDEAKKNGGHNGFIWSQRVVVFDGPGGFGR